MESRLTDTGTLSPGQPMMFGDVDAATGAVEPQGVTIRPTRWPAGATGSGG